MKPPNAISVAAFAVLVPLIGNPGAQSLTAHSDSKFLYCAYGNTSNFVKPGFETLLAIAVVEVNSRSNEMNVSRPLFELVGGKGQTQKMTRLVSVEEFQAPEPPPSNPIGYYLYDPRAGRWNGRLPAGTTRLRIRAEFPGRAFSTGMGRCRIIIGPRTLEGRVDAIWPSG
jgi:hypothetical protein